MSENNVTRRDFLKTTGLGTAAAAATLGVAERASGQSAAPAADRAAVLAAMGDTLIPSDPGDPGYKTLEPFNITAEVMKNLSVTAEELGLFNSQAAVIYSGKNFAQLSEKEREGYFDAVLSGEKLERETAQKLQRTMRQVRERVFQVFYRNYPEHTLQRDSKGIPILPDGDLHQITNPNTKTLVTGWDVAGYIGPLTWAEEERRRELLKKIDWKE
ncbi:MAG: hypothetical protein A3J28_01170 [Acidobacteria bacterium RIFCSPLOWO2_12_FULL_60_22]|nr:MAG: hypothetical protein A3J28_01170 [Acidobacteria bacterium RIFCSPLOWO2_12_FULL_60_22]